MADEDRNRVERADEQNQDHRSAVLVRLRPRHVGRQDEEVIRERHDWVEDRGREVSLREDDRRKEDLGLSRRPPGRSRGSLL